MSAPLVALDVGTTKVACAVGLPHERSAGFELLGSSLVAYPSSSASWLSDPLLVGQTIERALEATAVPGEFHRALVAMNHPWLASEQVRVSVQLGDEPVTVRMQDLDRLQRAALDQVLGIDREPLMVERLGCAGNGFEGVRDPRGLAATRLVGTFHVITMPMAARRVLVQAVESAGLEVAQLTHSLSALWAGIGDEARCHQRVLVVDIGGLSVDVGWFAEGVCSAARILPWGGATIAADIANTLQVTMDQATVWSLEGTSCRKPEVPPIIEARWRSIQDAAGELLERQPHPDAVLIGGRGALIDGFAEWLERAVNSSTQVCRSPAYRRGELSRQVGLSAAMGLLETATRTPGRSITDPPRLLNRLLVRTRTLLTEYF